MPNKKLIFEKLDEILQQFEHIKQLIKLSDSELFGIPRNFYFAERVMERLIGAAIDINMHIASDMGKGTPKDYFHSFLILGELKILPAAFAKKIAPSTSLRNILVHEYKNLEEKKFRLALKEAIADYGRYAKYIEAFLEQ